MVDDYDDNGVDEEEDGDFVIDDDHRGYSHNPGCNNANRFLVSFPFNVDFWYMPK